MYLSIHRVKVNSAMDVLVRAHRHTTNDETDFVRLMVELISDIQDVDAELEPIDETLALDEMVDTALDLQCELEELKQDLVEANEDEDDHGDTSAQLELKIEKVEAELMAQPAAVGSLIARFVATEKRWEGEDICCRNVEIIVLVVTCVLSLCS